MAKRRKGSLLCPLCKEKAAYWESEKCLVCSSCGYKMEYSKRDYQRILKMLKRKK